MKIRSGFVSNSSSSSFILSIPKTDKTCNSVFDFCAELKSNHGYDEEDIEIFMINYQKLLQENFDNGLGCMIESIDRGGEEDIERIVNNLGGNVQWLGY